MKKYFSFLLAFLVVFGVACTPQTPSTSNQNTAVTNSNSAQPTAADRAGLNLSAQRCTGTDKPLLTHLPMNAADFAMILPYGLMIGGHVTPVDHQYFSPTVFDSKPDAYNVYAMADSRIVAVGTRQHAGQGQNKNTTITDYRIVFTLSCRLFYYYDLVTALAPDLLAAYEQQGNAIDFPVKSGQLIGKIGGQTLDFAVWDTDKPLTNFIVPEHYNAESWKLYTADPLNYYAPDVRAAALAKYVRTAEPRSGKIDYDVDGKLIGNWFQVGTNGYGGLHGEGNGDYWSGHLSIAPFYLDPNGFLVSIGNWPGGAAQFATKESGPNPADVTPATGLVKYTLVLYHEFLTNNQSWDNLSLPKTTLHLGKYTDVQGCFLVQMLGARSVKAEAFKGKTCSQVSSFTSAAVLYER